MMAKAELLQRELEVRSGTKVNLRINENRSTMLSVQPRSGQVRVSLHQMFLTAPSPVVQALAKFIKGKTKRAHMVIQGYIEENLPRLDYADRLDKKKLITSGSVHDLKVIYDEIHQRYFGGNLNLQITWYGRMVSGKRNSMTFGLYEDPLRLVKIHRRLDQTAVPAYFVGYVIYHEILHHIYPAYMGEDGRKKIHNDNFKLNEKRYHDFERANAWLKENRQDFFNGTL